MGVLWRGSNEEDWPQYQYEIWYMYAVQQGKREKHGEG